MSIYNPYSVYRGGMGQPIPQPSNQISLGSIGYQGGITSTPYSNPYIMSGGYYNNSYNNYYNPYNGKNYWEEMQKQRAEHEAAQFKVWQLCEKVNGGYLNKTQEEIDEAIKRRDPNYIAQQRKEEEKKVERYIAQSKEEMTARIIIKKGGKVVADSKDIREKRKANQPSNLGSGLFSMNRMQYIDSADDYDRASRSRAEHAWAYGKEMCITVNPALIREFNERRLKYANTSMVDYFNNEFGHVYWTGVLEEAQAKAKADQLKNRYDPNAFKRTLYNNTVGNTMYNSLANATNNNYFKQPTVKSDLEISLPSDLNNDYAMRRKMFIDKIMANARRVGTDITMNGNIDVKEVYGR